MKNSYLANRVKALRVVKGYSQDYLAMQCKLSLRTIQRIESGQTEPHGDTLQRLAFCLDVTIADLVNSPNLSVDATASELPNEKGYIALIHLSALSFIIFPLLGAIVPFVLWVFKRNQIQGIEKASKRILNFQITWCIVLGACYAIILSETFFQFNIPLPGFLNVGEPEFFLIFIILLYVYNLLITVVNSILAYNNKRIIYYPSLNLLR